MNVDAELSKFEAKADELEAWFRSNNYSTGEAACTAVIVLARINAHAQEGDVDKAQGALNIQKMMLTVETANAIRVYREKNKCQ